MRLFYETRAFPYLNVLNCTADISLWFLFLASGHLLPQCLFPQIVMLGEVSPVLWQEGCPLASLTGLLRELCWGSVGTFVAIMALDRLVIWFRAGLGFSFCLGLNKRGLGLFVSFRLQGDVVELRGYIISPDWGQDWGSGTELGC